MNSAKATEEVLNQQKKILGRSQLHKSGVSSLMLEMAEVGKSRDDATRLATEKSRQPQMLEVRDDC